MTSVDQLIGECPQIVSIREQIRRLGERQAAAHRALPVLILGETGTGKGLVAQAIHAAGPRSEGSFVQVNCAALPEALFEAELFGFEKGAFTGARHAKPGLFLVASRGMIFLDEVSRLSLVHQAKLLKVVEQATLRRIGSTREEPTDAWIVTASNDDLLTRTRQGLFREDLYHRLAVVSLRLPPLRQRGRDILLLAERFLARACVEYGVPSRTLAPSARAALLAHSWPGNVRELSNLMERVVLLTEETHVTAQALSLTQVPGQNSMAARGPDEDAPLTDALDGAPRPRSPRPRSTLTDVSAAGRLYSGSRGRRYDARAPGTGWMPDLRRQDA